MMKNVIIYTDGACSGNPGAGGYAAILIYKGIEKVIKGNEEVTTNNRMELKAIIEGLKALKEKCKVIIYSDSAYVINAIEKDWISSWMLKGWRTSSNKEVSNIDLWKQLIAQIDKHQVNFIKVKGHSDNEYNNKCDKIARQESKLVQNK